MNCANCGNPLSSKDVFCKNCGSKKEQTEPLDFSTERKEIGLTINPQEINKYKPKSNNLNIKFNKKYIIIASILIILLIIFLYLKSANSKEAFLEKVEKTLSSKDKSKIELLLKKNPKFENLKTEELMPIIELLSSKKYIDYNLNSILNDVSSDFEIRSSGNKYLFFDNYVLDAKKINIPLAFDDIDLDIIINKNEYQNAINNVYAGKYNVVFKATNSAFDIPVKSEKEIIISNDLPNPIKLKKIFAIVKDIQHYPHGSFSINGDDKPLNAQDNNDDLSRFIFTPDSKIKIAYRINGNLLESNVLHATPKDKNVFKFEHAKNLRNSPMDATVLINEKPYKKVSELESSDYLVILLSDNDSIKVVEKSKTNGSDSQTSTGAISKIPVTSITASSTKAPMRATNGSSVKYYNASNMIDGNLSTAWCENSVGDGTGERIDVAFNGATNIKTMKIYSGYWASQSLYDKNSKPIAISVYNNSGEVRRFNLSYEMKADTLNLDFKSVESIYIIVDQSLLGRRDNTGDILISELEFYGY